MESLQDIKALSASEKDTLILVQHNLLQEQGACIAKLEKRIEELANKLAKNSRNSSKPPSSDGYDKPNPKSQRQKSGRSSGGQPGHKGSTLKQVSHPNKIEEHKVMICTYCGVDLSTQISNDEEVRQVFDLPAVEIVVTEHRAQIKHCPCCEKRTRASFPAGVTQSVQYGARLQATTTYLNQYQLLPYKRLQELLSDLFDVNLSQGTLYNILKRGHQHLTTFENEARTILQQSNVVHFDESGVRVKKDRYWLHVASTNDLTYYHINPRRGQTAMDEMDVLPDYQGVAVHDHWASYYRYDCQHVLCNAHHLRELTFAEEEHQQQWAAKLKACLLGAKKEVDEAIKAGCSSLDSARVSYHKQRYNRVLRAGLAEIPVLPKDENKKRGKVKQHKVKNLHDRLTNHKKEVLAFIGDFSLPFDNNLAERDVRMVKVKQKISGCFRSEKGAHVFSRIRGYISSVRKQKHNAFQALNDVFEGNALSPSIAKKQAC
jgi:transposase